MEFRPISDIDPSADRPPGPPKDDADPAIDEIKELAEGLDRIAARQALAELNRRGLLDTPSAYTLPRGVIAEPEQSRRLEELTIAERIMILEAAGIIITDKPTEEESE